MIDVFLKHCICAFLDLFMHLLTRSNFLYDIKSFNWYSHDHFFWWEKNGGGITKTICSVVGTVFQLLDQGLGNIQTQANLILGSSHSKQWSNACGISCF